MVIPPILRGHWHSSYAAICVCICRVSFWNSVIPPSPQVGTFFVVSPEPICCVVLYLHDSCEVVLAQPFLPDRSVVVLDVSVMLRLSRLDVVKCNAAIFCPLMKFMADVLRAIVDAIGLGRPPPFDDPFKRTDNPCRWQREVNLNAKVFAVEVMDDI